ncbi:TPA: OmpA family protein [Escherichia coli]|nr:OmpA family protein [Shigella sonnei]EII3487608.1 OmpA family protein [Escherichia coli]HBM8494248.1 OmpA family protein [Escherichia coli]
MRNTLKQAVVLWGMVLLLVLWSVFISPSGVLRWAGAAAIVLAVAALLIYRRRQAWTEMTGDAGLSSLPPETYRQPVVLVCGDMSAHLFTDSPVRQVSEGLYLLKAESLMQWLNLNVLAALNGPEAKCPPLAMAVGLVPSLPEVDNNLWQSWITARTGLTTDIADTGTDATLPFPDALLRRLPRQSGFTPLRRACVTMLGITTVAGIAALCLSATANRQLLRHIGDDLHQFYAVPAEEFITKARRLSVLKDDAVMLDGYYREGEPLRLGLGLYPGEQIRQPVLRAIRDYRPPEQKMEVTASLQAQTVRLDSMSLFDVGQARLKDGSTKVLVDALVNIRAKPGWLILVAGYTDATGDEKSNQQLSLRRAEAVRNWMLQTSDIPATCFAVQGLGESQPAATNDTPQGRAVNRRVEISLVPRSDACQDVK